MTPEQYFAKIATSLPDLEAKITRDIIAVEAEQFHAKNFRNEAFTDVKMQKWEKRKAHDKGKGKRALLVQSGTMKRHATSGRTVDNSVEFVLPLPYEKVHNEGGRAGRGAGFQMPKRQFMGESAYLSRKIHSKARKFLDDHFKSL